MGMEGIEVDLNDVLHCASDVHENAIDLTKGIDIRGRQLFACILGQDAYVVASTGVCILEQQLIDLLQLIVHAILGILNKHFIVHGYLALNGRCQEVLDKQPEHKNRDRSQQQHVNNELLLVIDRASKQREFSEHVLYQG